MDQCANLRIANESLNHQSSIVNGPGIYLKTHPTPNFKSGESMAPTFSSKKRPLRASAPNRKFSPGSVSVSSLPLFDPSLSKE